MKKLIAMACFMLAASPLAFAQDKGKDAAPAAAPAKVEAPKVEAPKVEAPKADAPKAEAKKTEKARKEPTETQLLKQEREKACNAEAADKKGDERKKFMSACVKDKQKSQQNRMSACSKEAGDKKLKGDDRKAFMKDCLSTKKG
jgi:hypothetical protein